MQYMVVIKHNLGPYPTKHTEFIECDQSDWRTLNDLIEEIWHNMEEMWPNEAYDIYVAQISLTEPIISTKDTRPTNSTNSTHSTTFQAKPTFTPIITPSVSNVPQSAVHTLVPASLDLSPDAAQLLAEFLIYANS